MDSTNPQPPFFGQRQPDYPVLLQMLRVTAATVPGPSGVAQVVGSSVPGPTLYVSFTQQMRDDGSLLPRDREPCLVDDVNGGGLAPGFHLGRLAGSWSDLPLYEVVAGSFLGTSGGSLVINITNLTNIANNYTLDVNGKSKFAISNSSNATINTLTGGKPGQIVIIWNMGGGTISLAHMAGNILVPLGVAYSIWSGNGVILEYDGSVWRFDHPTIGVGPNATNPTIYAVQHVKFSSDFTVTDQGNGRALVAMTGGGAGGSGSKDYWWYPPGKVGTTGTSGGGRAVGSPAYKRYQVAGALTADIQINTAVGPWVILCMPLPRPRGGTIAEVAIRVTNAALSGTALCGGAIYGCIDDGLDCYPGTLLVDLGVVDVSAPGTKAFPLGLPYVLTAGKLYWMCIWPSSQIGGIHALLHGGVVSTGGWPVMGFSDPATTTGQVGWKFGNSMIGGGGLGGPYDYDAAGGVWPAAMFNDGVALLDGDTENLPAIYVHYSA